MAETQCGQRVTVDPSSLGRQKDLLRGQGLVQGNQGLKSGRVEANNGRQHDVQEKTKQHGG
jgi:hypothetical protein